MNKLIMESKTSRQAFNQLLEHFDGYIIAICKKYKSNQELFNDLRQFGRIGLFSGVESFNPSKTKDAENFLKYCITRSIKNEIKRSYNKKNSFNKNATSLETPIDEDITLNDVVKSGYTTPEEQLQLSEIKHLLKHELKKCSTLERRVLILRLFGYSYEEIKERLTLSDIKTVDNTLLRVRKKIKGVF